MRKAKQSALEAQGSVVGSVDDFLEVTPEESALVDLKLRLSDAVTRASGGTRALAGGCRQAAHSNQSRVAKMEAGEASVSFDLLVRALVGLGATTADLAKAIQTKKRRRAA